MMDDLLRGPMPYLKRYIEQGNDRSREWTGFVFECRHEIDCDWYEPQWETGVCVHRYNGIKCVNHEAHKKTLARLARKARKQAKAMEQNPCPPPPASAAAEAVMAANVEEEA